jgi:DNA polymerase I-like protein with 3'-5' exonuclease and polymerase domains
MDKLGQYCAIDVELCHKLFHKMKEHFSQDELDLIDITIRLFTEPVLQIDEQRVEKELHNEIQHKQELLARCGVSKTALSSNNQFADLLRNKGVEPPQKISPTTGKATFAFAKNDLDFQALRGHEDESVRDLVEARMAIKSTIGETRAQRFLQEGRAGSLPVYLSYYGAHTGRWSGGNKLNVQNLRRGGELRKSILAPEGHVLVVADSGQIEARTLGWFADDQTLLDLFRAGEDVYKHMAASIYSCNIEDVTSDERFVGKVAVLGLGYNMGWKKFQWTLATGTMGPPIVIDDMTANRVVQTYRSERWRINSTWGNLQNSLLLMANKENGAISIQDKLWADCEDNKIYLPNGMYLEYPGLQLFQPEGDDWGDQLMYFDYKTLATARMFGNRPPRKKGKKIYGGLFTENITQALARIIVAEQMLAVERELDQWSHGNQISKVVTMTHDEIVACVPEHAAQDAYDMMVKHMSTAPKWCADIPLAAEGGFAREYSK